VRAWASWKLAVTRFGVVRLCTQVDDGKVAGDFERSFPLFVRERL
jgi:hypothetical protein